MKHRGTFFWGLAVVLIAVALLPNLWALANTPNGQRYMWVSYNPTDTATYLAKMRWGWLGHWRFQLMFTPEQHQGAYLNLFYITLGHLARVLGCALPWLFHSARLLGALTMMATLWWLSGLVLHDTCSRRWGFWFALSGGGIGWALPGLDPAIVDMWIPEAYGFYSTLVNAHFPWAHILLLLCIGLSIRWLSSAENSRHILMGLGICLTLLGILQPFGVALVGMSWGLWLVSKTIEQRAIPWKQIVALGAIGLIALLYPLYTVWAVQQDVILAGWNAQNTTPSPSWWRWVLGFFFVLPWTIIGIVKSWQRHHLGDRLLIAWLIATIIGIGLPLATQRRFSLGLSFPLGLVAGHGWTIILSRLRRGQTIARVGLIILTLMTPLMLILAGIIAPQQPVLQDSFYVSSSEVAAARALGDRAEDAILLASPTRGIHLPWLSGQHVVVGHVLETVNFAARAEQAQAFFDGTMSPAQQRAFLSAEGVDYIWVGPLERRWLQDRRLELEGVSPAIDVEQVVVFEVRKQR